MKPSSPRRRRPILGRLVTRLVGPCTVVARLASEALDRRLTWRERGCLRFHGLICRWCRRYARQLAWLHAAAPRLGEEEALFQQREMPAEFRDRLRQRLRDEPRA
ncbi:MAG: hypothetical protein ACKVYV_02385 [Limisphaerales bacterium]